MKSEKLSSERNQTVISERTIRYSLLIIELFKKLQKDSAGKIIGRQLLRSATSIGANVHEAQGAQSKADFIAKISIAHKETYESAYWLRVVREAKLVSERTLVEIIDETSQLVKILSSILITSKRKK